MRVFVAEGDGVCELTSGDRSEDRSVVRVAARDLQQARRERLRIRAGGDDLAVILDLTVAVANDFRSARRSFGSAASSAVHYAGTLDGLVGLISDIGSAGVADGVTLIPASPRQDVADVGRAVLTALALRDRLRAS